MSHDLSEQQLMEELENKNKTNLLIKLNKKYKDYLKCVEQNNDTAKNNVLSALIDECRSKERLCAVARNFVQEKLNISYSALLLMKRHRQI
jgi:tRNA isopentenyl-2-thiomethyl-A-37 hydroxylase MiaE